MIWQGNGITVCLGKPVSRGNTPFAWSLSCGVTALAKLAGVPYAQVFRNPDAIVETYRKGRARSRDFFGEEILTPAPGWAPISYGHVNTLGSELIFPEDGEVAHTPIHGSLEEGIRALNESEGIDFSTQGMFPFYLELWKKLKKAFPKEQIPFAGFKAEGPLTTAWCLRGHDFFVDIMIDPEQAKEYLRLVTRSVVRYNKLIRRINGQSEFAEAGVGLADDVAAMISPNCWPEMVVPFLEMYYTEQTSGLRSAHIEDLTAEHLKYLDEINLSSFDPSLSPKLTPALIRDNCRVPFAWRLNSTHYPELSESQVEQWVFEAAADGAASVFTIAAAVMCTTETAAKVRAFVRAAKEVKRLLSEAAAEGTSLKGSSESRLPKAYPLGKEPKALCMAARLPKKSDLKHIRVGIIRCDLHAVYYAVLMDKHDPLMLRGPGLTRSGKIRESWQSGGAYFYHYLNYADPTAMTAPKVSGFKIAKLWDPERELAEIMSEVFHSRPRVCDSFEEVSDDVDMVFIADCNGDGSDHLTLATPGLQKRVPTFIDKPFAYHIGDAVAIVNLAKKRSVPVLSLSILRTVPEAAFFRSRLPEVGRLCFGSIKGGFTTMAGHIHAISMAQHIFGNGVESVETMGQNELGFVHLNYSDREARPSHGVILECDTGPTWHAAYFASAYGTEGAIHSPPIGDFVFPRGAAINMVLARKMVRTRQPLVPYDDMLENIAVATAARKAQKLGRTVRLNEVWKP